MKNRFFFDKSLAFVELRSSNNNSSYKEHLHETFSVGAIFKGEVEFTYLNQKGTLGKNELVLIPPQAVHSCNPKENKPREYFMMYLDKQWCLNIQKELFPDLLELKSVTEPLLQSEKLYNEFLDLCELLLSNTPNYEKEHSLVSFISDLFSIYYKNHRLKESSNRELIDKIIDYLQQNIEKNISLDLLAKEFGYNKFFLSRVFKNETSLPPHTYHLNLKINRAKELIKKGEEISYVAQELGFADQSHFHRNFQKFVSATPKEYAKAK